MSRINYKEILSKFGFDGKINWFPGHMAKAKRRISETLQNVHAIIEVRDSRIPISSSNPEIAQIVGDKRRVVIMNKVDLCNRNVSNAFCKKIIKEPGVSGVILTDARSLSQKNLDEVRKACRPPNSTMKQVWLVCGMPNVGKSTLINSLIDRGKKASTSSLPGWTRGQTLYHLKQENALLLDTPGIMVPGVISDIQGLNLALCSLIDDNIIPEGAPLLAEYLLFILNEWQKNDEGLSKNQLNYLQHYDIDRNELKYPKLEENSPPFLAFQDLVPHINKKIGKPELDEESAARHFISEFRKGKLGKFTLDILE